MALVNVWHLRKVAETSSKPCDICFKPTTSVLITPDNKDHFYICQGHLQDRGFASPIVDEANAAAKKKEELDREIELVKREYEEKTANKKKAKEEKNKKARKDKDDDAEKKPGKETGGGEDAQAEKERDQKIAAITNKQMSAVTDGEPRIFALQKTFFQKRLDRIRNAEIAKRNRERLRSPNYFPSVPNNLG